MKRIIKSSDDDNFSENTIDSDDFNSGDFREEALDDEGISGWESAFMQGYDEAG